MQFIISGIIFFLSGLYVIFLDNLAASSYSLQKALVGLLVLTILFIYLLSLTRWRKSFKTLDKLLLLFMCTFPLQLLLIATGGLNSPFIIIIYLFIIGVSLLFNFSIALLFSIMLFGLILIDTTLHQNIANYLMNNIQVLILQFISLLVSMPIAYIVSYNYHIKDWFMTKLRTAVDVDEAILKNLNELIIATDHDLNIISVNDAVERTLLKSRSELLYTPIFDVLLLKDKNDKTVSKETFFPRSSPSSQPVISSDVFTLFRSSVPQRKVRIQIQAINGFEDQTSQYYFIITFIKIPLATGLETLIEKTRTKYEAMNEILKKQLMTKKLYDMRIQMILLEKIENDIYHIQLLKEKGVKQKSSPIDLTKLCRESVSIEQDFAKAFRVALAFNIKNFSLKDVMPLIVKNFHVKLEDWTGPFFTVDCDVQQIEIIIKKLIDISIFLSSTTALPNVKVTIERSHNDLILINVITNCPLQTAWQTQEILQPYYGSLYNKTNLYLGSGLEGYLVKTISDMLSIPLQLKSRTLGDSTSQITFSLTLNAYNKLH